MQRNLADFYFKEAKRLGFLARSAFKLVQIQVGLPAPSADACTALLLVLSLSQLNLQVRMVEARKKAADAFWLGVAPFTSERAQGDRSWEQCS